MSEIDRDERPALTHGMFLRDRAGLSRRAAFIATRTGVTGELMVPAISGTALVVTEAEPASAVSGFSLDPHMHVSDASGTSSIAT